MNKLTPEQFVWATTYAAVTNAYEGKGIDTDIIRKIAQLRANEAIIDFNDRFQQKDTK